MIIQSASGRYPVEFVPDLSKLEQESHSGNAFFIVDAKVAELYRDDLKEVLSSPHAIKIEAQETNKEIRNVVELVDQLVTSRIRRSHTLVAIGGGVIQDITCFVASIMLRGIPWKFYPTTLLAQADSCIGSKSSINVGTAKNIVGTFNAPREVIVCPAVLRTLAAEEIHSGIGEIIKVHAIAGAEAFDRLATDYDQLVRDETLLQHYIRASLLIKQPYIETDEFDRDIRNIFNYGHSFGHAIESVTDFLVPHGIAVSMGMSIANRVAASRHLVSQGHCERMQPVLRKNYAPYADVRVSAEQLVRAMTKDKKNTVDRFVLIVPMGERASIERVQVPLDAELTRQIEDAITATLA